MRFDEGDAHLFGISKFLDKRKLVRALEDYPVYSPPSRGAKKFNAPQEQANFAYFMEHKDRRLAALTAFMAKFSIELGMSPSGVSEVGAWLYRFGAYIVSRNPKVLQAIYTYEPSWTGEFLPLNIMKDVSIYAGEYIIYKTGNAKWVIGKAERGFWIQQPRLHVPDQKFDKYPSISGEVLDCCTSSRARLTTGSNSPMDQWADAAEFGRRIAFFADKNPPLKYRSKTFPPSFHEILDGMHPDAADEYERNRK